MIELFANVVVDAPIQRCFDITRSIEVHQDSSTLIGGRAVAGKVDGLSDLGDETTWSARFFGVRFRVRTKITEMEVPIAFREERVGGIPRPFGHDYHFVRDGRHTRIEDTFRVGLPLAVLGTLISERILRSRLGELQKHRLGSIQRICEGDEWRHYLQP